MFAYFFSSKPSEPRHNGPSHRRLGNGDPEQPDTELLSKLRAGDREAFTRFVLRLTGPLLAYARSFVRSDAIAEELVQDVLSDLWEQRETLHPAGSLDRHVFGALRFRALHVLRRWKLEDTHHRNMTAGSSEHWVSQLPSPDVETERSDLYAAVGRAISLLPPRSAEVFRLRWGEGLSYAQIAETLGITVKGAAIQMTRAIKAIRARLESGDRSADR